MRQQYFCGYIGKPMPRSEKMKRCKILVSAFESLHADS